MVNGAVATGSGNIDGLLDVGHDVVVSLLEGDNLHELVKLHPHLGALEVVLGGLGVLASGPLDAVELLVGARSVHHEAEAAVQVAVGDGDGVGAVRASGGGGAGVVGAEEDSGADDQSLDDTEDDQVGDVEGEHLGGRRGSGEGLEGVGHERRIFGGGGQAQAEGSDADESLHCVSIRRMRRGDDGQCE